MIPAKQKSNLVESRLEGLKRLYLEREREREESRKKNALYNNNKRRREKRESRQITYSVQDRFLKMSRVLRRVLLCVLLMANVDDRQNKKKGRRKDLKHLI